MTFSDSLFYDFTHLTHALKAIQQYRSVISLHYAVALNWPYITSQTRNVLSSYHSLHVGGKPLLWAMFTCI